LPPLPKGVKVPEGTRQITRRAAGKADGSPEPFPGSRTAQETHPTNHRLLPGASAELIVRDLPARARVLFPFSDVVLAPSPPLSRRRCAFICSRRTGRRSSRCTTPERSDHFFIKEILFMSWISGRHARPARTSRPCVRLGLELL